MATTGCSSVYELQEHIARFLPNNSERLYHEVCDGELRSLYMAQTDNDNVQLYEYTSGPLTRSVFESSWHAALVTIKQEALRVLFSTSTTEEACKQVPLFFMLSKRYLSEFMDYLDINGVAYEFEYELEAPSLAL